MFSAHGTVVRGKGEGRKLGYPTSNLEYEAAEIPDSGVWICQVEVGVEQKQGLAVIGMWTLANGLPSLEVHILDFDQEIYGQTISLTLLSKLHELKTFTDVKLLIALIEEDITAARAAFAGRA